MLLLTFTITFKKPNPGKDSKVVAVKNVVLRNTQKIFIYWFFFLVDKIYKILCANQCESELNSQKLNSVEYFSAFSLEYSCKMAALWMILEEIYGDTEKRTLAALNNRQDKHEFWILRTFT